MYPFNALEERTHISLRRAGGASSNGQAPLTIQLAEGPSRVRPGGDLQMSTIPLTLGSKIEKAMRLTSASWVAVLPLCMPTISYIDL